MTQYECTNCGYRISELEYISAKHDPRCPRCDKICFSFFEVVQTK